MPDRIIQIQQAAPRVEGPPYALIPFGLYYNNGLKKAGAGSIIDFCDGWERQRRLLVRKCKVAVDSAVFTFLCASIYGDRIGWGEILKTWEAKAVIDGYGKDAFNTDSVYLLEIAPYNEDVPEEPDESRYGKEIWRIAGEEALRDRNKRRRKRAVLPDNK